MKKIIKLKYFKSLAVVLSVTALIVISSTLAFFNSTDQTTNKFIGGRFDIVLMETNWDPKDAEGVVPGDELDKNPQVKNIERTSGYIYLKVTVPCDTQMVDNDDGTPLGTVGDQVPMYKFMVARGTTPQTYEADTSFSPKQKVNSHWRLVAESGKDYTSFDEENKNYIYVYAYANSDGLVALKKNELTEPLFDKLLLWNFNEEFDPEKSHNVLVEAYGIQTDLGDYTSSNISEIWSIIETGEGG